MPEVIDLRTTFGWTLTVHARAAARRRAVPVTQILEVIATPDSTYVPCGYGPGRIVYKRGEIAVVGAPQAKKVITVLWNIAGEWTDEEFARRGTVGAGVEPRTLARSG